ncbi:MAG: nodulation protein NfeD [Candidatus Dadabacteria bacterium]|nr:nodulation protein NfeD [Candidatus Dadabacteria bacterium]NIQ13346.1 nodulation protein NfeD [Candidatus Dadabacteria bacterium]
MKKNKTLYFLITTLVLFLSLLVGYHSSASQNTNSGTNKIIEIEINGSINPSTVDYIRKGIETAKTENASALLILLDTPGGLLNSTKDIVKSILNSEIPVIVYVYPKGATATSAGVFITLSAHIAAMSPGTSIGAAHPVTLGQGQKKKDEKDSKDDKSKDIMGEKLENYASSFIQSIAEERGRNAKWAIDAVRKSSSITANEALDKNVIDIISNDKISLLEDIHGKKININKSDYIISTKPPVLQKLEMNLKQKIVNIISTPDIAFLLLSMGSLGILLEFYNPGLIFPGVAGLISLIIGFISLQILPFNYGGLALLFIAIALFVAEVYATSYGLLSLAGLICFIFGALLLFDTPESDISVGYGVIIGSSLAMGGFFALVVYLLKKSFGLPAQGGFEGLIGQKGEVLYWGNGEGKVFVQGEYWKAVSDETLRQGDKIEVVESEGELEVKVSKI